MYYALVTEQSRKAKAAKNLYDYLKTHAKNLLPTENVAGYVAEDGIHLSPNDRYRVLNLKLHDEHLSPYFKSDMSLFHLLMIDEHADMRMYRTEQGWLIVLEGVQEAPKPFGSQGYDMR